MDEDATTMAVQAAQGLLDASPISAEQVDAVLVGSETRPYSAKPMSTTVAAAIGARPDISAADVEFACRGAIEALFHAGAMVAAGYAERVLVVGSDQGGGHPGDSLEQDAGAAAVAVLISRPEESPTLVTDRVSHTADLVDFHRRDGVSSPSHAGRFTGEPAYFRFLQTAGEEYFRRSCTSAADYRYAVFHEPNEKFATRIADRLGFDPDQTTPSLSSKRLGNPYAANLLLALSRVLPLCSPEDRVFAGAYGSGAGADCFSVQVQDELPKGFANDWSGERETPIDYTEYLIASRQITRR